MSKPSTGVERKTDTKALSPPLSFLDEIEAMRKEVLRKAEDIFHSNGGLLGRDLENWLTAERELVWEPRVELTEKDGVLVLDAAVPGVEPKDIEIHATPTELLLKASTQHKHEETEGNVHRCEFASGKLFRTVTLPKKISVDKVRAEYKNGILRISAPVAEEETARKITISG